LASPKMQQTRHSILASCTPITTSKNKKIAKGCIHINETLIFEFSLTQFANGRCSRSLQVQDYVQTSRECPNIIKFTENYMQNPSNSSKSLKKKIAQSSIPAHLQKIDI
jgi:hypothetical protein